VVATEVAARVAVERVVARVVGEKAVGETVVARVVGEKAAVGVDRVGTVVALGKY
jgi:hypothetical protein